MPRIPKTERNEHILKLREENPEKYTMRKLAEIFGVSVRVIWEIIHRAKKEKNDEEQVS